MRPTRELWPGAALALASAALFGASTPLAKSLLGAVSPWLLAGLLYLGSGIGLAAIVAVAPRAAEAPLARADCAVAWPPSCSRAA